MRGATSRFPFESRRICYMELGRRIIKEKPVLCCLHKLEILMSSRARTMFLVAILFAWSLYSNVALIHVAQRVHMAVRSNGEARKEKKPLDSYCTHVCKSQPWKY